MAFASVRRNGRRWDYWLQGQTAGCGRVVVGLGGAPSAVRASQRNRQDRGTRPRSQSERPDGRACVGAGLGSLSEVLDIRARRGPVMTSMPRHVRETGAIRAGQIAASHASGASDEGRPHSQPGNWPRNGVHRERKLSPSPTNENGLPVGGDVWTNTLTDGTLKGTGPVDTCKNWTSAATKGVIGSAGATDATWTDRTDNGCDNASRLYCFQQ
jgi:hypothetical protein